MNFLSKTILILSTICFSNSCCKPYIYPSQVSVILNFENFSDQNIDSFTVQSFVRGSNFAQQSSELKYEVVQHTDNVNGYSLYAKDFDWEVTVLSTKTTYRFNDFVFMERPYKSCGEKLIQYTLWDFHVNDTFKNGDRYTIVKN